MVRTARFSSDDPGWIDPDDRARDCASEDDFDLDVLNPSRAPKSAHRRGRKAVAKDRLDPRAPAVASRAHDRSRRDLEPTRLPAPPQSAGDGDGE